MAGKEAVQLNDDRAKGQQQYYHELRHTAHQLPASQPGQAVPVRTDG